MIIIDRTSTKCIANEELQWLSYDVPLDYFEDHECPTTLGLTDLITDYELYVNFPTYNRYKLVPICDITYPQFINITVSGLTEGYYQITGGISAENWNYVDVFYYRIEIHDIITRTYWTNTIPPLACYDFIFTPVYSGEFYDPSLPVSRTVENILTNPVTRSIECNLFFTKDGTSEKYEFRSTVDVDTSISWLNRHSVALDISGTAVLK